MFLRRIKVFKVQHSLYNSTGCGGVYIPTVSYQQLKTPDERTTHLNRNIPIPDSQLGLFDISGEQLLIDLDFTDDHEAVRQSTPQPTSRFPELGLQNIMTDDEKKDLAKEREEVIEKYNKMITKMEARTKKQVYWYNVSKFGKNMRIVFLYEKLVAFLYYLKK
jgi:hypothetical protein